MKLLFLIITSLLSLFAQSQEFTFKPISINDKVPTISLGRLFNDSTLEINFNQFRGKWVILDFWNHHCTACLDGMPKMEALQNQFNAKIQVILVTVNSAEQVNKLFSRLNKPLPRLPMLVGDKILFELFPHVGEPHHVWIDPNGNVKYITNGYNANAINIQAVLSGKETHLALRSVLPNFDNSRHIISYPETSDENKITSYSLMMHGLHFSKEGVGLRIFKDSLSGKPIGIYALNAPWLLLFTQAYGHQLFGDALRLLMLDNNNRIILLVKDSTPFYYPKDSTHLDEWIDKNQVSYESKVPVQQSNKLFTRMQEDLNYMTNYTARIEKRKMKCLVLIRTSRQNKLKTKDLTQKPSDNLWEAGGYHIRNRSIHSSLFVLLVSANCHLSTPVLDDTGLDEPVDMEVTSDLKDIPALKKELWQYDLDLVEQVRDIDMLVIRDKTNTNQ